MAIGDIIVGVDIGTSKVCTVVGEVNNFGQIEIIANTSYKCSGLKKGKIINEEEKIEIVCNFCNKKYTFTREELKELIKKD